MQKILVSGGKPIKFKDKGSNHLNNYNQATFFDCTLSGWLKKGNRYKKSGDKTTFRFMGHI